MPNVPDGAVIDITEDRGVFLLGEGVDDVGEGAVATGDDKRVIVPAGGDGQFTTLFGRLGDAFVNDVEFLLQTAEDLGVMELHLAVARGTGIHKKGFHKRLNYPHIAMRRQ